MSQRPKLDGKQVVAEPKPALKPGERFITDLTTEELRDAFINTVRRIEGLQAAAQKTQAFIQQAQGEYAGINAELAQREKTEKKG